ncbi:MAG: serine hydrolase domain-containing protein [Acidobacteriota bacterium]
MEKWFRRSFYLFASLLWLVGSVSGQGIPTAAPAEVGLSAERLTRIDRVLEDAIDRKQIAGAVALISRRGKVAYFNRFGMLDIEAGKLMRRDAIFRIASMTKAITSVGVMMLAEEGRFLLNDPVSRYLPEFRDMKVLVPAAEGAAADPPYELVPAKGEMTIRHLLTHTSGIT